jgi:hypothetical protein
MLNFVLLLAGEVDGGLVQHVPGLLSSNILVAAGFLQRLIGGLGRPSRDCVLHMASRPDFVGHAYQRCSMGLNEMESRQLACRDYSPVKYATES